VDNALIGIYNNRALRCRYWQQCNQQSPGGGYIPTITITPANLSGSFILYPVEPYQNNNRSGTFHTKKFKMSQELKKLING
jgi:hypothetical protein